MHTAVRRHLFHVPINLRTFVIYGSVVYGKMASILPLPVCAGARTCACVRACVSVSLWLYVCVDGYYQFVLVLSAVRSPPGILQILADDKQEIATSNTYSSTELPLATLKPDIQFDKTMTGVLRNGMMCPSYLTNLGCCRQELVFFFNRGRP